MPLVRWDPWRDIAALERQFDERFGRGSRSGMRAREWMPMLDVHQDGDDLVIEAELAGVDPKDVEITIENSVLRIAGTREENSKVEDGDWIRRERFSGRFERQVSLPQGIDPDAVTASAKNGIIEIRVPYSGAPEPHRVQLQTGSDQTEGAQAIDVSSSDEQPPTEPEAAAPAKKADPRSTRKATGARKTKATAR